MVMENNFFGVLRKAVYLKGYIKNDRIWRNVMSDYSR